MEVEEEGKVGERTRKQEAFLIIFFFVGVGIIIIMKKDGTNHLGLL